jgi:RNA polymerase sigma-70 factor (ECF subfamily)
MPASPEDQALIDLLRQGDQDAARQLYDTYLERLVVLARRRISQRLASRVDPEDVVQSVFRTFFTRIKDGRFVFEEDDDLCKLLAQITLHKTLRQVAFHKAAKRDPSKETDQGEHHREQLLALLDRGPTPEAQVTFLDQLESLLSRLPEKARRIIELRLQGHDNKSIMKELNIPYDRDIRRVVERVREIAENMGLPVPGTAAT